MVSCRHRVASSSGSGQEEVGWGAVARAVAVSVTDVSVVPHTHCCCLPGTRLLTTRAGHTGPSHRPRRATPHHNDGRLTDVSSAF